VRVGVEHERRAGREARQNLLEAGVPVERGELEDPVDGVIPKRSRRAFVTVAMAPPGVATGFGAPVDPEVKRM
jgi:hypothetical protein